MQQLFTLKTVLKTVGICAFLLAHTSLLQAQGNLVITENSTQEEAIQMIQDVFVGSDMQIFNATYLGKPYSSGRFTGDAGIGFTNGFLLTTGRATNALGPNNESGISAISASGSDPDVAQIAGGPSFDACGIEFDFIPETDHISFRYVFASEEYPEYAPPTPSAFNDIFGFFISGPGIDGPFLNNARNVALLPGSVTYVSINSVNPVVNPDYFIQNYDPVINQNIQYDGYTILFIANATVIPNELYHIKLVISDIADPAYDSGLFFEANSFTDQDATAINSRPEDIYLNVSPNPTTGLLRLNVNSATSQPGLVVVVNALGQQVVNRLVNPNTEAVLDLQQQPGGMYTLIVRQGDQVSRRKLIISK
ncbi:MAG: T9SS type A sorting domain-containing protein [Bacteroidales bacterium]|nr:T9SS type A sorting domain-containing protein [Bacteroidales bacterium]